MTKVAIPEHFSRIFCSQTLNLYFLILVQICKILWNCTDLDWFKNLRLKLHLRMDARKGPSTGLHSMVLIGHRKEGNADRYLLQNWWKSKPFVEMGAFPVNFHDHVVGCFTPCSEMSQK
jgi:hypothetical protein